MENDELGDWRRLGAAVRRARLDLGITNRSHLADECNISARVLADIEAGVPQFQDIYGDLAALLHGRTLVAHNADFDYGFLTAEAHRADTELPVDHLLCTVDLAARLHLGLPNLKLTTLAHHYRIDQLHPHDALDDATVLAQVFRQMLPTASQAALPLPIRPVTVLPNLLSA